MNPNWVEDFTKFLIRWRWRWPVFPAQWLAKSNPDDLLNTLRQDRFLILTLSRYF